MICRTTTFRSPEGDTATVGIIGDIDFSTFCYADGNPLELLRPLVSQSDIVIANIETVISNQALESRKEGILLKSDAACVEFLRDIGVNFALLANNHIDDFGEEGVTDTVENLKSRGISVFGLVNANGISIKRNALSFRLAGFGTTWQDGSIVPAYGRTPGGILRHRELIDGGGHCLYFIHGFEELYSVPFPWRVELLETIAAELKPAAVICGHSHVYQGWVRHGEIPICLGYGNGFMNLPYHYQLNSDSRIGCYSIMHFDVKGCYSIDEYPYLITNRKLEAAPDSESQRIFGKLDNIHGLIDSPRKLQEEWENACFCAWEPRGMKNWPIIRSLYDWHRRIKKYDASQNGVVYIRAMRAAYLKLQYGMDVFHLRDDEQIKVVD